MGRLRWLAALLLALTLVAAGCGGDDGGDGDDVAAGSDGDAPEAEDEPEEPEGQVLLEEPFDDDSNLWGPVSDDIVESEIADGALTFDFISDIYETIPEGASPVPFQQWPSAFDGVAGELTDTHLEATTTFTRGGTAGLSCRIADPSAESTDYRGYVGQIASSGVSAIVEFSADGTPTQLARYPEADPDADPDAPAELPEDPIPDHEDDAVYDIAFDCIDTDEGVELTLTLDGEEILSVTDTEDPITTGTFGVVYGVSGLLHELEGFQPFSVSFDEMTAVNLGEEIDEETIEAGAGDPEDFENLGTPFGPAVEVTEFVDPGNADPQFEALATACFEGDFARCDQLYQDTPVLSEYEAYGATCGGRLETGVDGGCVEVDELGNRLSIIPSASIDEFGTDEALDALATDCSNFDFAACDELWLESPGGSGYEAFGGTCGRRAEDEPRNGDCLPD